jgi:rRNA maturation endonuclease Nob1
MKKHHTHLCTICDKPYRKQDFIVCPHCGGDGGGTTPKSWKPTKKQKKEFIKKQQLFN